MRLGEAANAKFAAASSKKPTAGAYDITPVALRIDRRDHQGLSMMDKERIALLRGAFDAYLEKMGSHYLEPTSRYLPYDFQELKDRHWIQPGGMLVLDELNELTNSINCWASSLRSPYHTRNMTHGFSGTWAPISMPGKMVVSYAIGGMEPLDMAAAHAANLAQYHRARACYEAYLAMLRYRLAPTTD